MIYSQVDRLAVLIPTLDSAIGSFITQMKLQGVWEAVTLQTASEFGRTMTNNGVGTDHGWAGNHLLAGGSVRGGRLLGAFPSSLVIDASDKLQRRGLFIPTTSWEAIFNAHAQWLGVEALLLPMVLPNAGNFKGGLLTLADVFKSNVTGAHTAPWLV